LNRSQRDQAFGWLEWMSGAAFWGMHAAIILSATAILLLVRVTAGGTPAPAYHLMVEPQPA